VVILILSIGLSSSPARASESRKFDIPAGPAEIAVQLFARQAHMSLLYEPGSLNHFRTRALRGKYEPIEALRLLLEGSGLDFVLPAPRYISVHPGEKPGPAHQAVEIIATVEIEANVPPTTLSELPAGVTIKTINGEELTAQGFTTLPDWARTLTQNQGFGANEATAYFRDAMSNIAYGSGLNLYGIGQRATLILLNGQRLAPSGTTGNFTDISNIPLSAVDHIDLISDGASTIYGADAVGGIVNIVLRGNNAKAKTAASVGAPHSLSGSDLSQSIVFGPESLRSLLGVELYERNGLPAAQRSQATSNLTNLGGSNFNTPYGNPGSLLDSSRTLWGIPPAQDGTHLADLDHLPAPNSYDRFSDSWVLPQQRRINVLFSATYTPNDDLELTLNALGNWRWIKTHDAALTTTLIVPHTNPFYFNPVKNSTSPVEVLYGFGKDLGSIVERATVQSGQATLGAKYAFNSSWNLQFTGGYTYENQLDRESNLVNFDELTKYLDAADPTVITPDNAFNPFGAGSNTNPNTLAKIRTEASENVKSSFTIASLKTVGSIPVFAAGPTTLTTGYDYRRQAFLSVVSPVFSTTDPAVNTDRSRTLNAVYSQLSVPVLAGQFSSQIPYELKLAGGARYEHFSDVGGAFTPSLGFSFNTTPGTSVFGTWARMFRPPNLPDLNEANNFAAVIPLRSGAGFTNTLVWGGNNADLRPETAKSWMLGVKVSPPSNPKISVETEYFNIGTFNQILPPQLLSLTVLTDPQYSYLVTRDVTPATLANICSRVQFAGGAGTCQSPSIGAIVDLRLRGAQKVKADGFDFKGGYRWDVLDGEAVANLQATYILHYKETQSPGDDFISYRNTPHKPVALRLRGVFGWEDERMSVLPAINFQSGYNDTGFTPSRPVRAWTTWDLVVGYKLRWLDDPQRQSHSEISLRGLNIFNSQPPFINNNQTFMGYDPENGDLLGRRVSLRFEHEW
jgi:iron complex outermembrane receptor protein